LLDANQVEKGEVLVRVIVDEHVQIAGYARLIADRGPEKIERRRAHAAASAVRPSRSIASVLFTQNPYHSLADIDKMLQIDEVPVRRRRDEWLADLSAMADGAEVGPSLSLAAVC
jgi:hypothetical protein